MKYKFSNFNPILKRKLKKTFHKFFNSTDIGKTKNAFAMGGCMSEPETVINPTHVDHSHYDFMKGRLI